MSITHITSLSQLNGLLGNRKKLTVIDFHATWCAPCKVIAPAFDALAKRYTNVNFCKVDVDAAKDVAERYGVRAMPTFVFLMGSTHVDEVKGADQAKLQATVQKHAAASVGSAAFSGKGNVLGGPSTNSSAPKSGPAAPVTPHSTPEAGMDPQIQVLLLLVGAYLVFWWMS